MDTSGVIRNPLVRSGTRQTLRRAAFRDTLSVLFGVFVPTLAKGVIIRRRRMVRLAERFGLDDRAVRCMQYLRNKYGSGPLMLRLPFRNQALVLTPEHVHRVLDGSPEPFATASSEKRAALSHFEPKGALISHGAERAERRRFNEQVLQPDRSVHTLADSLLPIVEQEARQILSHASSRGELAWDEFAAGWFRLVRRVVFGEAAREDHELTGMIDALRARGNWALIPVDRRLRERFFARMAYYFERAEDGSLARVMSRTRTTERTAPLNQVPQWLFAFDPAGMATARALALLSSHPDAMRRGRDEARMRQGARRGELPFLRASVLESLRLWPTAPLVLRQSTRETEWNGSRMPAGTGILIFAPFFHRDDERLADAHRFSPDIWLDQVPEEDRVLIPFSAGPATCPGRHLVLMLTSAMLANLVERTEFLLVPPDRLDPRRLQGTLDHYSLRFRVSATAI